MNRPVEKRRFPVPHTDEEEWPTPKKTRVQEDLDFRDRHGIEYPLPGDTKSGIPFPKAQIFRDHDVPPRTAYRHLNDEDPRRLNNSQIREERRGAEKAISDEQLKEIEKLVRENGVDGRTLTFADIKDELHLECHPRTIQNYLGDLNYHRCIACRTSWVSPDHAKRRKKWAEDMLAKYPEKEDWYNVRFSDEVHFGFGDEGTIRVIRQPGERLCPDCVIPKREPAEKDVKRLHAWAAIGHNFKSKLYWYDVPGNSNGKMTHKKYVEILDNVVRPWVEEGQDFVLEEDGDSGHGYDPPPRKPKLGCMTFAEYKKSLKPPKPPKPKQDNIVVKFKKQHNIVTYKNCAGSPDVTVIEAGWNWPKRKLRAFTHWTEESCRELAEEGWEEFSMEAVNSLIDTVPERLRAVIDKNGEMTGY
jgi:hypothetical protein